MSHAPRLCLIEDDIIMGESLCDRFALEGLSFDWHRDGRSALRSIGRESYSAIISDVRLPDVDGQDLLRTLLASGTRLPPFLFITAYGSVDRAVEALKLGAADYITKPFDIEQLIEKTRELIGASKLRTPHDTGDAVLGVSHAMRRIEELLPRLASHGDTVLITGESGVGKERVAQLLHTLRPGFQSKPFVAVNCGALSESLLESELFGHERGAFTGAGRSRRGLFEQAEGGSLFLDEIGDMSPLMQAKLLRAIQERQIMRVGGERAIAVNLRLICATNKNLRQLVEQGRFREDLFYRVNVIQLRIPPLRERQEDVLWLARRFLAECAGASARPFRMSPQAESALLRYHWPGNVRELKHAVDRACILALAPLIQPWDLFQSDGPQDRADGPTPDTTLAAYLSDCEREFILRALEEHQWRVTETADALGISRKNLWEKMRKLGISGKSEP
ncbi:MAG TPA: sigma-54 dependent transcriptional regulator [Burkholderiales bacterium]|nr:sigma-54 dependent transcriptional regulator [Burkholderiales bacterium]